MWTLNGIVHGFNKATLPLCATYTFVCDYLSYCNVILIDHEGCTLQCVGLHKV